jgi:hypothetical protein
LKRIKSYDEAKIVESFITANMEYNTEFPKSLGASLDVTGLISMQST